MVNLSKVEMKKVIIVLAYTLILPALLDEFIMNTSKNDHAKEGVFII